VVGNVQDLSLVDSIHVLRVVVDARRDEVGVISLPETDVDIEGRGESRHLHVVCPLAGLSHLLDVFVKLLLQLFFGVDGGLEPCGARSRGLAFWVSPNIVDSHVLSVEARVVLHVLDGGYPNHLVHLLVTVELIGQGVEQTVAWWCRQRRDETKK